MKVGDVYLIYSDDGFISIDEIIDVGEISYSKGYVISTEGCIIHYLAKYAITKQNKSYHNPVFLSDYLENPKKYENIYKRKDKVEFLIKCYFEENVVEARKWKLKQLEIL